MLVLIKTLILQEKINYVSMLIMIILMLLIITFLNTLKSAIKEIIF